MRHHLLAAILAATAAGCTAAAEPAPPPAPPPAPLPPPQASGECDAGAVQDHIGHRASAQSGAVLLRLTGARQLRWVPPRTAVTMDYRPDRLTVSYGDDMVIERISCG